ncbi:alpha-amylase family glycosyl hydrolase [Ancylobacter sp. MQZ15Z-1]|uniref:Alpha-amylase family glycosyl hydrolase n=1 Tax=Ancylobacter mangrovi TaxID=2972472 RepID=A0A9X2PCB5_9HYPH|nr:alpha-amylase family glycosyl hydrolase [Ancylobacter mangrovi]MCS0494809.1 alpha-amylase family glycosyl hydrolase [Ancylobacter mangrovi]
MNAKWWQRGIFYQVYPRSFQDTNGNGIGDLEGIRERLDYLVELGIDAIWISPIYPSPMADHGYDVSDYCGIDPVFGDFATFDRLVEDIHAHGLKLVLDFVPNHTSNQHPWFLESSSSCDNPKRDWYIWRDPAPDGGPPNNWVSYFSGSGWEFHEPTGQYYYHAYLKEQPDLNWRNPEVREEMHNVLRFWMKRGVDGFRVDVIWHLIKDALFRDDPPNPDYKPGDPENNRLIQAYSADQPEVHPVIAGLRRVVDEYPDRVLIGEIYLPVSRLVTYYGEDLGGANLPFNFQLIGAGGHAKDLSKIIMDYEAALPPGGWPNWVLGNHDQPRIASRIGPEFAPLAGMLLLTLRGTPTMYYGDELGMEDVPIPKRATQDPWEINEPGIGVSRDPERTPMQWDASPNAGFTTGTPWLPVSPDYAQRNVATLDADPRSMLTLHRRLIELRRSHPALEMGSYRTVSDEDEVLVYLRELDEQRVLVVLNLSREARTFTLPEEMSAARALLSTRLDDPDRSGPEIRLRVHEGIILEIE